MSDPLTVIQGGDEPQESFEGMPVKMRLFSLKSARKLYTPESLRYKQHVTGRFAGVVEGFNLGSFAGYEETGVDVQISVLDAELRPRCPHCDGAL